MLLVLLFYCLIMCEDDNGFWYFVLDDGILCIVVNWLVL